VADGEPLAPGAYTLVSTANPPVNRGPRIRETDTSNNAARTCLRVGEGGALTYGGC
jgi:hypothetical protein